MRNTIDENKRDWTQKSELQPNDFEIQRWLDRLDQTALQFEAKWGYGNLEKYASAELAGKWELQRKKLNDAIVNGDLHKIATMVNGSIRGYVALEKFAMENGNVPNKPNVWDIVHPDNNQKYRIVVNDIDAHSAAEKDVIVYTLREVARVIHGSSLLNKIKQEFPGASVENVTTPIDWGKGEDIPF